ncbi:hypothetical protein EV421DRAFT_1894097 [Armillaria borealis]|uniref:CxC2-like cysteine cluster KDZ transposase-associated domain-containing protein n=1 Tax=Armillaria borealis TaxID=47425 RepID=A0AA39M5I3_9AGAR|nr:hypothetical protein EV421DRAFT_1894097 [Armillaria borealis]
MWKYNPKKHGKNGPARDITVRDYAESQPSAPAVDQYQHTHFSMREKEGLTGVRVHPSVCNSSLVVPSLGSQHPETDKHLYPSIKELSLTSFLDPDYVPPSAEIQGSGEEEECDTRVPRPLGDHPLFVWSQLRSEFLNEILKLDAFETDDSSVCEACNVNSGSYCCLNCVDTRRLCQTSIVAEHQGLPLHKIEGWRSSFFCKTTLAKLGLNFDLGHERGTPCLFPLIVSDFVVVDMNGIHTVNMAFFNCTQGIPQHVQLLRRRLFPMTTIYPHTAFTFGVLHFFQLLSFMSKVSTYKFYHTLDRYESFLRVMREWRYIRVEGTKQGELALCCPVCPQPSINLPLGWIENLTTQWLYCFNQSDPGLNLGYAYFVEEGAFRDHLATFAKVIPKEEKSMCNNHDAVKLTNSQAGHGAAATGVGAVVCGCHDMKCPLSVGDLQKGERYLNMDYFILSTLTDDAPPDLVISYDIACQWHKNFFTRISRYPEALQLSQPEQNILYLVPKFHLPTHILKCRDNFSFNFSTKVGHTDGEAPEHGWAATNALAASTKEMEPGARRDTLDDHFGDYNWRKIIILADMLCTRLKEAVRARLEHVVEFIGYEDALCVEHSESIDSWRQMVLIWEGDRSWPNPFSPTLRSMTENAVHLELTREEKSISSVKIHHDVMMLLLTILDRVWLQHDIDTLGPHSTDLQRSKVQAQANRIQRKIEAWIDVQKVYMPKTALLRAQDDDHHAVGKDIQPSKVPLYLPSTVLRLNAIDLTTQKVIIDDERCLRLAQANDTLALLRDHLLLKSYLTTWRQRFSRGQHHGTKANTLIHRVNEKIAADTLSAKLNRFEWQGILQPLKEEHVRGLDQYNESSLEGHCNLAWIWKTHLQDGQKGLQEALRIEWCKSRA